MNIKIQMIPLVPPTLSDVTRKDGFLNRFFFNYSNAFDNRVTSVGFPDLDTVLPRVHVIFLTKKVHLLLKDMIDGSNQHYVHRMKSNQVLSHMPLLGPSTIAFK